MRALRFSLAAPEAELVVASPARQGAMLRAQVALPPGAAGRWIALAVSFSGPGAWWAQITLEDETRAQIVREAFLGPRTRWSGAVWRRTLLHVPAAAGACEVRIFAGSEGGIRVRAAVLGRPATTLRLLAGGIALLPGALGGDGRGRLGRLRALLGQAPARRGEAPPYALWRRWFADPGAGTPPFLPDAVLVVGSHDAQLAATADSVRSVLDDGSTRLSKVRPDEPWPVTAGQWVVLLGEGERLTPWAIAALTRGAGTGADLVYGDAETLGADGAPRAALFAPDPGPALLRTGLLARGACLVRWPDVAPAAPRDAEAARLALALAAWPRVAHVAAIVSGRPEAGPTRSAALVAVVGDDLASHRIAAGVAPAGDALRVIRRAPDRVRITAIVPSACRAAHVLSCLRRIEASTREVALDILVAVSRADPADRRQARMLAHLAALPRTRILRLDLENFNYSEVNNRAAAEARGDLLLFLNDDVAPITPGWLGRMAAHFADPDVIAAGARLLYGNGLVQHDGVVLGLANLVEHAGRLRASSDAGTGFFAGIDREVSAATAACLLVRAEGFRAAGGFDPGFAIALNDVDLCLKLRAAGGRIVQCGSVLLTHYESLSLGRHYRGERAKLEAIEIRRLRERWGAALDADPYYNPQASLEPGREWMPAFVPRHGGFSATLCKSSASIY